MSATTCGDEKTAEFGLSSKKSSLDEKNRQVHGVNLGKNQKNKGGRIVVGRYS
jgi:hypothetical protein